MGDAVNKVASLLSYAQSSFLSGLEVPEFE